MRMHKTRGKSTIMLKKLFILLFVISILPANATPLQPGRITSRVTKGKLKVRYYIYTPKTYKKGRKHPLMISFSPGGSGKSMVKAFFVSMEKAGWIVVGCDRLRNGTQTGKNPTYNSPAVYPIEDELLDEILAEIPHTRLYLSGFSGGGLRAFDISARRKDKISGIISCGGWLGGERFGGKAYEKELYRKGMYVAMLNGNRDKAANWFVKNDTQKLK